MSVMAHRSKGSRSERIVSGQDLPEVVPWQDAPQRKPSERASHAFPQAVAVDTTPIGEKLESRFSRFSLASTTFVPVSPVAPERKNSFKPNKKKHWVIIAAIIVIVALAIAIAAGVAVSLSQKHHQDLQNKNGAQPSGPSAASDNGNPATLVVVQTAAPSATPSGASATASSSGASSTAPTCPNYVGPGISEVPPSLPGQVSSKPPGTIQVNIQFASKMPYPLVSNDQQQQQQIQNLVPQAFAFALSIDAGQIKMGATIPNDTAAELCYIQTVAQVFPPSQYATTLRQYAYNWSSPLFHSPQQDVYTLMTRIDNMTFPGTI